MSWTYGQQPCILYSRNPVSSILGTCILYSRNPVSSILESDIESFQFKGLVLKREYMYQKSFTKDSHNSPASNIIYSQEEHALQLRVTLSILNSFNSHYALQAVFKNSQYFFDILCDPMPYRLNNVIHLKKHYTCIICNDILLFRAKIS